MTNINLYKFLKKKLKNTAYKGYPLDKVCGSFIAKIVWDFSYREIIFNLLFNPETIPKLKSNAVLCTYSTERKDYHELMKSFFPDLTWDYVRPRGLGKAEFFHSKVFSGWATALYLIAKLEKKDLGFRQLLILFSIVVLAIKIVKRIEKYDLSCEQYICFNSSYLLESFFCYYFRIRGVPTLSLQHGMYFSYNNTVPLDVINYENVCSDELLCWGEYSKQQIASLVPSDVNLTVAGYPYSSYTECKLNKDFYLVVLPRKIYLEQSIALVEMLLSLKIKLIVRPHPSIKSEIESEFSDKGILFGGENSLKEDLKEFSYLGVIGFNTTALFEALLYDQVVYCFDEANSEFENPGFGVFDGNGLKKSSSSLEKEFFYSRFNHDVLCEIKNKGSI
ncbi:hypothetical protein AAOGI_01430 [Agarivorans albus]